MEILALNVCSIEAQSVSQSVSELKTVKGAAIDFYGGWKIFQTFQIFKKFVLINTLKKKKVLHR